MYSEIKLLRKDIRGIREGLQEVKAQIESLRQEEFSVHSCGYKVCNI